MSKRPNRRVRIVDSRTRCQACGMGLARINGINGDGMCHKHTTLPHASPPPPEPSPLDGPAKRSITAADIQVFKDQLQANGLPLPMEGVN